MRWIYGLVVLLSVWMALSFSGACAQEETMRMESEALGRHQRPLVVFPHETHSEKVACTRCHHDFDEFGSNRGAEGEAQRCGGCHTATPAKNPIPLMKAFHLQCKGCHQKMVKTDRFAPPRTCGGCHRSVTK
jgi:hypothetical protein